MDNGVLLETKTLVELIRRYIRDQVRVFSVFHPRGGWTAGRKASWLLSA